MKDDIVTYFIKIAQKVCPALDAKAALELEDQIRRDWGGQEPYISKNSSHREQMKNQAVQAYLTTNKPVERIEKETGISRASLYRHLKK